MSLITEKLILDALVDILDPSEGKPITSFIPKIIIKDEVVFFTLEYENLSTLEQIAQKEQLKILCINQIKKISDIKDVKITITSSPAKKQNKKLAISNVKRVIVVASGKGGVGKSTIACNLAMALSQLGKRVALVDADIYGPSIPKMFGIMAKPEVENNMMIPISCANIKLMSMGFLIDPEAAAVWRGPMISKALFQLIRMTNWAHDGAPVDVMIIDTPPGTGDIHLSLAENYIIDQAILVTTPQEVALIDVRKCYDMFIKLHIPVVGIVENMSYFQDEASGNITYIFGKEKVARFAKNLNIKILGQIPILPIIAERADQGVLVSSQQTEEKYMPLFIQIASSIL